MKTATVAFGMFAAMANAAAYPRMINARHANTTEIAQPGSSTTLTVIATNVETITSCKPTITNCPAKQTDIDQLPESDKEPVIVTNTVVLTTTVCPVEDAPKISSSVKEDADKGIITGSTVTLSTTHIQPDTPKETGTPETPKEGGENSGETPGEDKPKGEKPKGDKPKETASPETPKEGGENSGETPEEEEQTTTTTATSTSTKYTTVLPKPTGAVGGENSPETPDSGNGNGTPGKGNGSGNGNGTGKGDSEECVPETITVTAPASTVYVTVDNSAKTTEASSPKPTNVTGGDNSAEEGQEEDDDEVPEDCIPEDEDEEDEEDENSPTTPESPKGDKPKHEKPGKGGDKPETEKPVEDGENSPEEGEDDEDECESQTPEEPSSTVVLPPVETPIETPIATPIIPGGDGADVITTSIMPGSAQPTGSYRFRA